MQVGGIVEQPICGLRHQAIAHKAHHGVGYVALGDNRLTHQRRHVEPLDAAARQERGQLPRLEQQRSSCCLTTHANSSFNVDL